MLNRRMNSYNIFRQPSIDTARSLRASTNPGSITTLRVATARADWQASLQPLILLHLGRTRSSPTGLNFLLRRFGLLLLTMIRILQNHVCRTPDGLVLNGREVFHLLLLDVAVESGIHATVLVLRDERRRRRDWAATGTNRSVLKISSPLRTGPGAARGRRR